MTTQLEIANLAIYDASGNAISDIPDGNQLEGLLIDQYWQHSLDYVLGEHPWRTFRVFLALTEDTGYSFVDETYDYAYELPSDWIRPITQEDINAEWVIRSNRILSNYADLELGYIARPSIATVSTTLSWPAHFVDALAAYLSMKIAPKLQKKGSEKTDWEARYFRHLLVSQYKDSQQDRESTEQRAKHTTATDSWLQKMG